jgi:hypothetical protein
VGWGLRFGLEVSGGKDGRLGRCWLGGGGLGWGCEGENLREIDVGFVGGGPDGERDERGPGGAEV